MDNPYQPPPEAGFVADRRRPLAPGETHPQAKRAVVLGVVASCLYFLPPVSIILGIIAMGQANRFTEQWYENPQLRGKGAAIAGRVMGIANIFVGIFMALYYVWAFSQLSRTF